MHSANREVWVSTCRKTKPGYHPIKKNLLFAGSVEFCLSLVYIRRPMYEYRCDERQKGKTESSTRLGYTGFHGGLEHLKIQTRFIDERSASEMGECVI